MRKTRMRKDGSLTIGGGQRGFTLIEMIVVTAISIVVMLVVANMVQEVAWLSFFNESNNDLAILSQRPMNAIQREVLQSKVVFVAGTNGNAYLTYFQGQLPGGITTTTAILPTINSTGPIQADSGGTTYTGNCIVLARQLPPIAINLAKDPTYPSAYPAITPFKVDRYQFEYFYLVKNTSRKFGAGSYSVDLYRYRSIQYADYFQLVNDTLTLSATQKTWLSTAMKTTTDAAAVGTPSTFQVQPDYSLKKVKAPNLQYAYNPGQPIGTAFWTIDAALAFPIGNQLTTAPTVAVGAMTQSGQSRPDNGTLIPELFNARISGKMPYTIAYRIGTAPGTPMPGVNNRNPVPRFFDATAATTPVDCGFEVQIVGGSGNRQVMTRLVLYSNYQASKYDSQESFVITSFSGLST